MPYFKQNKILLIHIPKTGGTSIEKYFANKSKIKLGPNNLYFSYYEKNIQTEVDNYRKMWKKRMVEEKNNLEKTKKNDHFQNFEHFANQSFDTNNADNDTSNSSNETLQKIKENLPEFKFFRKIKLCKELEHSLQHLTWIEMQTYSNIFWNTKEERCIVSDDPHERNDYDILTVVRNPYDRVVSELLFRGILTNESIKHPEIVFNKIRKFLDKYDNYDNHKIPQYLFIMDNNGEIIKNITILRTETLTSDMHRIGYIDFNHYFQISKCNVPSGKTKYSNYLNAGSIELINNYYKRDFELFGYDFL
jgi:hypothetical protein